jgi:hypothetical protein
MLDKFERNPDLKFKFVYEGTEGQVIILDEIGRVVNEEGKSILSCFNLNSKFSLVNEPVDKMEALKAFSMGKTIYCSYANNKYEYIPCHDSEFTALKNKFDEPISIEEILYGEWFIEED